VAKFRIAANAEVDMLTKAELDESLAAQRAPYQAVTVLYLPVLFGAASGGALAMGGDSGSVLHSPDAGYVWSVRHLSIEGLTAGATPDVVNINRGGRTFWKLSGAPPAAETWGRGEFIVRAGMSLSYTNFGAFASVAQIVISGTVWQCPEQFVAELGL
jgi:hypothetical protein